MAMKPSGYLSFLDAASPASASFPSWKQVPSFIPHRVRRKWRATKSRIRSRQSPASHISSLNTSFSPADTLYSLRHHQWSFYDGQYLVLLIVALFSLCVIDSMSAGKKTFGAALLITGLLLPAVRQFLLPFLPIATWLLLFFSGKFISSEYRPPIWVRVLPALENILYGANLSGILSAHKSTALNILAWIPYGLTHYGSPFVVAGLLFLFGPPGTLPVWARSYGFMNLTAVIIQILFPCTPPWYEELYGLAPAHYGIPGSPGGLAAIDELLGIDLYTSQFTASPVPFGAFPSLHSGWASLFAMYLSYVFPKLTPLFVGYVMWIWWATMYLSHHYLVDLVAGSILAGIAFYIAKTKFLPRVQEDKLYRWDYDYVETGNPDEGFGYGMLEFYEEFHPPSDSDEWTVGSSSASAYSAGSRSPTDDSRSLWEGDTLASASDNEQSTGYFR